jgi:hypothetical protein
MTRGPVPHVSVWAPSPFACKQAANTYVFYEPIPELGLDPLFQVLASVPGWALNGRARFQETATTTATLREAAPRQGKLPRIARLHLARHAAERGTPLSFGRI